MEPMRRHIGAHFANGPWLAIVCGILNDLELQTGRMVEPDELLSEPLLNAGMLHFVVRQVLVPEFGGALLHRIGGGLDLARSWTARHTLVGERGVNRSRLRVGIGVIQVVVGVTSIKKDGLFN